MEGNLSVLKSSAKSKWCFTSAHQVGQKVTGSDLWSVCIYFPRSNCGWMNFEYSSRSSSCRASSMVAESSLKRCTHIMPEREIEF
jgi:hypothetical protein